MFPAKAATNDTNYFMSFVAVFLSSLEVLSQPVAHRITEIDIEGELAGGVVAAGEREDRMRQAEFPVVCKHVLER